MFSLAFAEDAHAVPVAVFLPFVIVTLAAIIRADRQQGDFRPRVDFPDPADDLELGEVAHAPSMRKVIWPAAYRRRLTSRIPPGGGIDRLHRSAANTSELPPLLRISYAVLTLNKK